MGLLEGRRAIVTGGASGIGAATARRFAAEGARVAVFDIDAAGADAVAAEIGGLGFGVNVAKSEAVQTAVAAAAEGLGGLDVLFNNAGVGNLKPLDAYTDKEWERLIGVNLTGTFNGLRAALPIMQAGGGGAVVNMASVSGIRPTRGESPYAAAKAGVIALTQSAALEYGPTIRVNCVSPGFIHTALTDFAVTTDAYRQPIEAETPLGRVGTGDDVAKVVVFLASDLAGYVSGQNIVVDGGSMLPSAQIDHMLRDLLG